MKIMAIVNVTPDSFYDGGQHATTEAAVARALRCVDEGADIVDIGGESSRPGSETVGIEDELHRVIPVVEGIRRRHPHIPISIDTTKARVLREAACHGIQYANDITALRGDPEMAATIAELRLHVILTHMQGTPKTMQAAPHYADVVAEVCGLLKGQSEFARAQGISRDRILLDPGFGFGKTVDHNVTLLRQLPQLAALGYPLVVGTSRKSFIGKLSGVEDPLMRLPGSLATLPAMCRAKVAIVRTHDVAETRQFLSVFQSLD